MGNWMDGKALAQEIQAEVAQQVQRMAETGIRPGLAVVLVGNNPASHMYVRSKVKTCETLGMRSEKVELPAESTAGEILSVVERFNRNADIHGILVQACGNDPQRLADYQKKGYTLIGDVNPGKVLPKCSLLTPVPGGVGPLTIAMLMADTVKAAALQRATG